MNKKSRNEYKPAENPVYHNAYKLLRNYRDVVWGLELSVTQARNSFRMEYGTTIEEFLDCVYAAGSNLAGTEIEHQAKSIEKSRKMLQLIDSAVEILRRKHKHGEVYYWILYYTFLCPQQLQSVEDIIEKLAPHVQDVSLRTYYRRRQEAIDAFGSILWGYTANNSLVLLDEFFPGEM